MIKLQNYFIHSFCVACTAFFVLSTQAQISSSAVNRPRNTIFTLRVHYGVVYAHTSFVQNTAGAHPAGVEFEVSKQLVDKKLWEYYRCYPRMGVAFSYFNLNSPILGNSYNASYFIEPNYRLSSAASVFLRTSAGVSYLTNPHDSLKNPANQSYSLPVNFFLTVGIGINCRVTQQVALSFMTSFQHNSNGGFRLPNHGLNYVTASVGVKYSMHNNTLPVYKKEKTAHFNHSKLAVDAGLFYSPKSGYNAGWVSSRKYLAGVFVQVSRQVSALDAITLSAEVYHDDALASIKKILGDASPNNLAGILVGHEFVFRRIFFSQQIGVYVYKNTNTFSQLYQQPFPTIYHRWGLRYRLDRHFCFGFNFLAHNQVADFIDVRMSYRF